MRQKRAVKKSTYTQQLRTAVIRPITTLQVAINTDFYQAGRYTLHLDYEQSSSHAHWLFNFISITSQFHRFNIPPWCNQIVQVSRVVLVCSAPLAGLHKSTKPHKPSVNQHGTGSKESKWKIQYLAQNSTILVWSYRQEGCSNRQARQSKDREALSTHTFNRNKIVAP